METAEGWIVLGRVQAYGSGPSQGADASGTTLGADGHCAPRGKKGSTPKTKRTPRMKADGAKPTDVPDRPRDRRSGAKGGKAM
jgi:hypothetical protein